MSHVFVFVLPGAFGNRQVGCTEGGRLDLWTFDLQLLGKYVNSVFSQPTSQTWRRTQQPQKLCQNRKLQGQARPVFDIVLGFVMELGPFSGQGLFFYSLGFGSRYYQMVTLGGQPKGSDLVWGINWL